MIQSVNHPFKNEEAPAFFRPSRLPMNYDKPETFAFETMGGEIVTVSEREVERIRKENIKAAAGLNPARDYIRVFLDGRAAGNGFPYIDSKTKYDSRDVAAEQARREKLTKRIMASAPGNFI